VREGRGNLYNQTMQMKSRTIKTLIFLIVIILVITLIKSFWNFCYLEGLNDFPIVATFSDLHQTMEFGDLHLTESLKQAKEALENKSGIYCISHIETGRMYIGSSVDLGGRMLDRIFNHSSNTHLQRALTLYGLAAFTFKIVEFCNRDQLLVREQHWLNWLFNLSEDLRYNFLPTAGSSLGYQHTEETRAKMSATRKGKSPANIFQKGENNPMRGRTGELHPMFGKAAANAIGCSVCDLDGNVIAEYPSVKAAAEFIGVSRQAVSSALQRGSVIQGRYKVFYSPD